MSMNPHPIAAMRGPIAGLPPELLIEIFACCAASDPLAPLPLRRVSKWWRAIIHSSPRVWQFIFLDDQAHSISFLRTQAGLWAQRSVPLPIDVELKVECVDLILPMLSPLLPSINRWRSFVMQGQREESQTFPKDFLVTTDSMRCLRIYIQQGGVADIPQETFVADGPDYAMQVWVYQLPRSWLLAPLRFTTVNIMEDILSDIHSLPIDILDFLSACPELEIFHYTGCHYVDDPPREPLPVVSLPNLHTLRLKSTCMARAILSSLYVPRLTGLHLAHLNIEYELRGEYHEEGDSEDDAQDFSQSPSSDHATGMGLRKLIARSHPPLMVLDMDFSDMRTKDFRYLFDRLPSLHEFQIVASDMSDTVIQLLHPFTLPGEGGTIHTRLPRLQSLGLYNCQQLSGDAIVETLSARVQHTDNEPLGTHTLTHVSITACEGFTFEHRDKLAECLGRRLRQS